MLFDSAIRKDLARNFGATLVVILTIVLTMFLIRTLGQAAGGNIAPQDVVLLLGYTALAHLPTMLALSLFIAVVATLGRMYKDSEMTIWFASGIGLARFVRPVLRVSWPVLLLVATLALFVWPWVNHRTEELKQRYERRSDLSRVAPGQFQSSRDGSKVFFIERDNSQAAVGRNVFILAASEDTESVTTARRGHIEVQDDERYVVLERGQRNEEKKLSGEHTLSQFETYKVKAGERMLTRTENMAPKAQPTFTLMNEPKPLFQGELTWRIGLALGAGNLVLLAIGLASRNPRRASNWSLLFALLSFVVYYNLINLSQAWVASSKLSMGAALGLTHGCALAVALLLLWWRDNANTVCFSRIVSFATRGFFKRPRNTV